MSSRPPILSDRKPPQHQQESAIPAIVPTAEGDDQAQGRPGHLLANEGGALGNRQQRAPRRRRSQDEHERKTDVLLNVGDPLMTVAEVAQELRCSKPHVYKAIHGELKGMIPLPSISMGRTKLIRRSSLERWKRENESDGTIPRSPELTPLTQ